MAIQKEVKPFHNLTLEQAKAYAKAHKIMGLPITDPIIKEDHPYFLYVCKFKGYSEDIFAPQKCALNAPRPYSWGGSDSEIKKYIKDKGLEGLTFEELRFRNGAFHGFLRRMSLIGGHFMTGSPPERSPRELKDYIGKHGINSIYGLMQQNPLLYTRLADSGKLKGLHLKLN